MRFLFQGRQVFFYRAAQVIVVQMGVDLRRQNAFVAQHLLYLADARSAFEQMRGERVAEGVGADDKLLAARSASIKAAFALSVNCGCINNPFLSHNLHKFHL